MEAQLWRTLYRHLMSVAHEPRRKRQQFGDRIIVLVYLWSVLHDRAVTWACSQKNWPKEICFTLPSDTTMSRRLPSLGVQQLIERVVAAAADLFDVPLVKAMDSKPMLVGAYSKDRDAKRGRLAAGQFARGYRLHAMTHGRTVQKWTLSTMCEHDSVPAATLLSSLRGGGYVVVDNAYDSNDLHQRAAVFNHQLVAPAREVNKGVRDQRYNCPQRLRALDLLDSPLQHCGLESQFGIELYNQREAVEGCFGELSMMGLNYLPAWVRGPRRVALWTAGKILLHLCRRGKKQGLMR